ncbi:NmrA/HSCARG family protein [Anianabacter salinae]|uniref:NmrA/HSCARG family protein n=1 Tax=Anianabacter salinae TaxID=2851023 RepID=UPI00225E2822|nr:NmrA/HSCARG family protein [Anianabacter salinae]MBV0913805.1 NmrA/HSCARG family protein [Anianabacter salinae]
MKTIVVFGASGQQGGGVVRALKTQGKFRVRAVSRDAARLAGLGADEVISADLTRPETLGSAFAGAHGAFVVTNFWEGPGVDEPAQGRAAVEAARAAGAQHFIWSTLPNVAAISGNAFDVPHFTQKAHVDELVSAAGFPAYTFVEPPFYFQNLTGQMAAQPQGDGSKGWVMPMAPDARVIHAGDISELGTLVAGAFANPDRVGTGQHLALSGDRLSWNDIVKTLRDQGHNVRFQSVPGEVFDTFFPQAPELRRMMNYFEAHSYFGPDADEKIALAREVATVPPTSFADWARVNFVKDAMAQ